MRKGLFGIVLIAGILLTPISAYADSNSALVSSASNLHGIVTQAAKPPYKANGHTSSSIAPNSTTAPTSYWSIIGQGTYSGNFTRVSNATGIYTNYYFIPSVNNQLIVDTYVTGENSGSTQYLIMLLDKTQGGTIVYSNELPCGTGYTVTYPKLNSSDDYYIEWAAVGDYNYIDGNFDVHY